MSGYIGFFDILGYQNFLEHNRDEKKQEAVLNEINSIKDTIEKSLQRDFSGLFKQEAGQMIMKRIEWLVFSDTIVFTLEPIRESTDDQILDHIAALMTAKVLMYQMFAYGLPLRGAVHIGNFKRVGNSMAGQGSVDVYKPAQTLNFAGCVITQVMMDHGNKLAAQHSVFATAMKKRFVCDYGAPLSDGTRKVISCLMWYDWILAGRMAASPDLRSVVHNKFWEHDKQLSDSRAVEKLEETERFLRYCLLKHDRANG